MALRLRELAGAAFVLCACSAALDTSLEHKRCTSTGRCLAGYTCSETGFCERANDAQTRPAMPDFDADLDSGMNERDAAASFEGMPPSAARPSASTSHDEAGAAPPLTQGSAAQSPPADTAPTQTEPTQAPPLPTQPMQAPPATPASQTPPAQNPPPQTEAPSPQQPGAMGACAADQTRCGASCVDLQHDVSNCGACAHACTSLEGGGPHCEHGSCAITCAAGLMACDEHCLDVESDATHCGDCKKICKKDEICSAGRCAAKPKAGEGPN